MDTIDTMLDQSDKVNRHPSDAIELGAVPSKISPVVAYVFSMAVWFRSCIKATPLASNGRVFLQYSVSADTV